VLHGHQHRAAPLATDSEALHQPGQRQQQRGRHPDLLVRRQQLNTSVSAAPNRKKSYHSMAVPMKLANATLDGGMSTG
jgi:hypothetical protein